MTTSSANTLYADHASLVEPIARAYARAVPVPFEEILQAARIGLWEAARRFDASRGVPFPAYAPAKVRWAITDMLRAEGGVPRRAWKRIAALDYSAARVPTNVAWENDGFVNIDPQPTAEDKLADIDVSIAVAALPFRERELVRGHYLHGSRFDHIAEGLGITKSWGSRLHTRALGELAKRLAEEVA